MKYRHIGGHTHACNFGTGTSYVWKAERVGIWAWALFIPGKPSKSGIAFEFRRAKAAVVKAMGNPEQEEK